MARTVSDVQMAGNTLTKTSTIVERTDVRTARSPIKYYSSVNQTQPTAFRSDDNDIISEEIGFTKRRRRCDKQRHKSVNNEFVRSSSTGTISP